MEARIGNRHGDDIRETLIISPPSPFTPLKFRQCGWLTNEDTRKLLTCRGKTKLSNEMSTYFCLPLLTFYKTKIIIILCKNLMVIYWTEILVDRRMLNAEEDP